MRRYLSSKCGFGFFKVCGIVSLFLSLFILLLFRPERSYPQQGAPSGFPDPSEIEEIVPRFAEASSILVPQIGPGGKDLFAPRKAIDGDWATCWAEAAQGPGVGEWIRVLWLTQEVPTYVSVLPGWAKNKARWENNPRIKVAEIVLSNGYRQDAHFEDKMQMQMVALNNSQPADWLKIVIQEVYPGKRFEDTSISEIKVFKNKAGKQK